ncbi:MAG TPA: SDR family oxidoreductase [Nitrososphaeraceae archaeon]
MNNDEVTVVTGASSTVGSEIVNRLTASGQKVRAAVRDPGKYSMTSPDLEMVHVDYYKPETFDNLFEGGEKLFLLVPFVKSMLEITSGIVKIAKKQGVKYIVNQSLLGLDVYSGSTISRLHRRAEKVILESSIPFTILRPNYFMQNFIVFFSHTIKSQGSFYISAGDGKVSFFDARDMAHVAVKLLTANGQEQHIDKTYNVTGPESLSYKQAAEILSNQIGKKISYINITDDEAKQGLKDIGVSDQLIPLLLEIYNDIRGGYASGISSVVQEITGNKPISFSNFARDYAKAFR